MRDSLLDAKEAATVNGGLDRVTYALFCVFGLSSWLTINATFGELPIFAHELPEGWAIASYLALAIQAANVFPLAFLVCTRLIWPQYKLSVVGIVTLLLCVGVASTAMLAFLWDVPMGTHSMWLLLLAFVSGGVDCTTSVVYWPFVSAFRTPYVSALSVGEGLSGVAGSMLTLIQSPGVENRFSVKAFFLAISALMGMSFVAFAALNFLPRAQRQLRRSSISSADSQPVDEGATGGKNYLRYGPVSQSDAGEGRSTADSQQAAEASTALVKAGDVESLSYPNHLSIRSASPAPGRKQPPAQQSLAVLWTCLTPLLVLCWASFLENGAIMSVRTYATLPFKHGTNVLFWTGTLVTVVDPLAAGLTTWRRFQWPNLKALAASWTALAAVIIGAALCSPNPPLKDSWLGGPLMVLVFVTSRSLVAYTRAMCVITVHKTLGPANTAARVTGATYVGVAIQLGALVGSVLMFLVVNHTHLFASH